MNRGQFEAQINTIGEVLNMIGIGNERVYRPQFPTNPKSLYKGLNYNETWDLVYKEQHFNFSLTDNSLFQFRFDSAPVSFHYVFYECPYKLRMDLDEFLEELLPSEDYDENDLIRDYENYLQSTNKAETTPIRYDYDPGLYQPCIHPASHFHFGFNNNIRIGTKKILRPLSFFLFILRQIYPENWNDVLGLDMAPILCRNIRESIDEIGGTHWNFQDEQQMFLA